MALINLFGRIVNLITGNDSHHVAPKVFFMGGNMRPTPRPYNQRKARKRFRQTGRK